MDNSFLRFTKNDFQKALKSDNFSVSTICQSAMVRMKPNETFFQITNLPQSIAFAGNIKAELIDSCQNVKQDITDRFFYTEASDINGVVQLEYEFGNVMADFMEEPLLLKLTHTVSDAVWYSNPFVITDNNSHLTTRIDYGHDSYFNGISYDKFQNRLQSVRVNMYQSDIDIKRESKEYTQLSGMRVSHRVISTKIRKYKFDRCDNFTFERLESAFAHDIIYIDNYRVSDKPTLKKGDRIDRSNFFTVDIEMNLTEVYREPKYQLFPIFDLIQYSPKGSYTLNSLPALLTGGFNKDIVLNRGVLQIWNDTVLIHTFTNIDISLASSLFRMTLTGIITTNGSYFVTFTEGLFNSNLGETYLLEDPRLWTFNVLAGEFDSTEFNNTEFLTN